MFVTVQIISPETAKYRKLKVRERVIYQGRTVIRGSNHPGVEASSPEKNQFQKVVEVLFPSNSTTSPTVDQGTCQGEEGSPQSVTVTIEGIPAHNRYNRHRLRQ